MDFTRRTYSEEGEDSPIGRKGGGMHKVCDIDYLEKGKMITGLSYTELKGRFDDELKNLAKKSALPT